MKLSTLSLRHQFSRRVFHAASIFSISAAKNIPKPSIDTKTDPKIQSLNTSSLDITSTLKNFKWASSQKKFHHSTGTYCSTILKLGMSGFVNEMEEFCKELVKAKCPNGEKALIAAISKFVENCRLVEAKRVFGAMVDGGCKPSVDTANLIFGAMVNEKRELMEVLFVYKDMVRAGTLPNVHTLNYLIEALCEADRLDLALDQYRRMRKKHMVPDCVTYRILICSFLKKGKVDDYVVILNEMLSSGCGVDFEFCATVVPLLAGLGKVDEVMKMLRKMKESKVQPDSRIYDALLPCLVENFRLDDAVVLIHELLERGITLAENVVVGVVKGFCHLGRFIDASKFMEESSISDVVGHNALLEGYCKAGHLHEAIRHFDLMFRRHIVDEISWNIILRILAEMGMAKKAMEFICRMIIYSFVPNSATYCSLIVGNCRLLRFREAFEIFLLLRDKNWVMDSDSYAVLIEGLCKDEMFFEATDVFYYMAEKRCALDSSSLNILINFMCATSKVNEVVRLRTSSYQSGTIWTSTAYDTIMLTLLEKNKPSEVLKVFSVMLVEGVSPSVRTHHILLNGLILQDKPTTCARVFTRMVDVGLIPDSETLGKLISCLVNYGQLHSVLGTIDTIVLSGDSIDSSTFSLLVRGLLNEGYKSEASHLLDLMLEKGWVPDARTHAMLIGSDAKQEGIEKIATISANSHVQDNVESILLDSFGC